jgi:hypothetical protein
MPEFQVSAEIKSKLDLLIPQTPPKRVVLLVRTRHAKGERYNLQGAS